MDIYVTVRHRRALPVPHSQFLVCGNEYLLHVLFDAEWDALPDKYVRILLRRGGRTLSADIPLNNGCCLLPALLNTDLVQIGVFSGSLCTTAPARFACLPAVRDIAAELYRPDSDVLRLMLARLAELTNTDHHL
ncbi:MAG: hypothetical protein IKQ91_06780 [Oscillospiraceae bacterium]|nr:hypothetical protein [Oscillospiraceae bacterium]